MAPLLLSPPSMSPGLSYFLAREMIQAIGVVPVCGLILKKHWAGYVGLELGSKTLWFRYITLITLIWDNSQIFFQIKLVLYYKLG